MKKKVVHFTQDYLKLTATWIYGQIANNSNYEHVVFAHNVENEDKFPVEKIYSLQQNLNKREKFFNKLSYKLFKSIPYFQQKIKTVKPDLIHAHFGNIGFKALKLAVSNNIPLVTTFYGYDIGILGKQAKYKKRYKKLFRYGALFLTEGNNMKKELEKLGCPAEKIKVYHLGVDVEKYNYKERIINYDEKARLLFAATLVEKKGLCYAIEAFAKVLKKYPNIEFRIIGEGPEQQNIDTLIDELKVRDKIKISGYVDYAELQNEMLDSHIFIQPSITSSDGNTEGGAPVSLIDAQATGMPIIATFHADIPEVVINNKAGLLSSEKNVDQLAENIIQMLDNKDKWKEYGEYGRNHIIKNYNVKKQGEVLGKIYDEVIESYSVWR